jgi:hypothetical protein
MRGLLFCSAVFSIWYLVYGIWYMVYGIQYLVFGKKPEAYATGFFPENSV